MGMKRLPLIIFLILVVSLAACTRSASQSATDGTPGSGGELPFPTPGDEGTPDMMGTLLAGGFATQTAQAQSAPPEATPEPQVATATPLPQATPTQGVQGEAPAAFSTATLTPEPQDTGTACNSPYTVQAGEWVYSIARKCGLDPDDIIAVNNLRAPFLLYPGDKLDLPGGGNAPAEQPSSSTCDSPYTVKAGDWVYSIARACGLEPQDVINANNLAYPYTIYPGDKLTLQ